MAAGREYFHSHGIGDFADGGKGPVEVLLGFRGGLADSGDQLHGVQEQLLLDVRVFVVLVQLGVVGGNPAQDLVRHGGQLAALRINQCEFPFHTKS